MAFTNLLDSIKTILEGVSKIQATYKYPTEDFSGTPAAVVIPSDNDSDYETNVDNQRTYAFQVSLFVDLKSGGTKDTKEAYQTMYDLIDDVMNAFDADRGFTGAGFSPNTGETLAVVRPVPSSWEIHEDLGMLEGRLIIKCFMLIDTNLI